MKKTLLFISSILAIFSLQAQIENLQVHCSEGQGSVTLSDEILQNADGIKYNMTSYSSTGDYSVNTPSQTDVALNSDGGSLTFTIIGECFPGAMLFDISYNTGESKLYVAEFNECIPVSTTSICFITIVSDEKTFNINGPSEIEYGANTMFTSTVLSDYSEISTIEWFFNGVMVGQSDYLILQQQGVYSAPGVYLISAKATFADGTVLTDSQELTILESPQGQTNPIEGEACAEPGSTELYTLMPELAEDSWKIDWWINGATTDINNDGTEATVVFDPWFNGTEIRVGINYSSAPWYAEYRMAIESCGSATPAEDGLFQVAPNPSTYNFTITAKTDIYYFTITDPQIGWSQTIQGISEWQSMTVGENWSTGSYIITAYTQSGQTQSETLIKQ